MEKDKTSIDAMITTLGKEGYEKLLSQQKYFEKQSIDIEIEDKFIFIESIVESLVTTSFIWSFIRNYFK